MQKSTFKSQDKKPNRDVKMLVVIGSILICLFIVLGALLIWTISHDSNEISADTNQGAFGGLLNGDNIGDPSAVTKEDLEEEYESRPEITGSTQEMLFSSITQYLSQGKFSELDSFLAAQQSSYKNAEGDEAQAIMDWQSLFGTYRSDITATMNLSVDNAAWSFMTYANPEVLAAAIAYSPISIKKDAFVDWSAIMIPAVTDEYASQVDLEPAELEDAVEQLDIINAQTETKYIDIVAYDMTLFGYRCRFFALGDENGYYRPYTLKNIDGHLISPLTRDDVTKIENALDPYHNLDEVISFTPYDEEFYTNMVEQNPDLFDEDGNYIGSSDVDSSHENSPQESDSSVPN